MLNYTTLDLDKQVEAILAEVCSGKRSADSSIELFSTCLKSFIREHEMPETAASYVFASEKLRDKMFPNWPLAHISSDTSLLPEFENVSRSQARAVGLFLSVAIEELCSDAKQGAKILDLFLHKSGLLTTDVKE